MTRILLCHWNNENYEKCAHEIGSCETLTMKCDRKWISRLRNVAPPNVMSMKLLQYEKSSPNCRSVELTPSPADGLIGEQLRNHWKDKNSERYAVVWTIVANIFNSPSTSESKTKIKSWVAQWMWTPEVWSPTKGRTLLIENTQPLTSICVLLNPVGFWYGERFKRFWTDVQI